MTTDDNVVEATASHEAGVGDGSYLISIQINVSDKKAIFDTACEHYRDANPNSDDAELEMFFGTRDDINMKACLLELAGPGTAWPGADVENSWCHHLTKPRIQHILEKGQ